MRGEQVVAVEKGQVFPGREQYPGVAGGSWSLVLLVHEPETRITGRIILGDDGAFVGRSVIDHDDLKVRERLPGDGLERRFDKMFDIAKRHHDAQLRHV